MPIDNELLKLYSHHMHGQTEEITITSLNDYIAILDTFDNGVFFRGQREDWPLLPKIARITTLGADKIISLEKETFERFKKHGRPYFNFESELRDDYELLTLGQHYGLPTRLIDWTSNPLVALWFSLKDIPKMKSNYGVVWIYTPTIEDDAQHNGYYNSGHITETPRTLYFRPILIDQRLIVQKSIFTIHGSGEPNDEKKFIPMQDDPKIKLKKLRIPSESSLQMINRLADCGIDDAAMFPGLEGLCRQIETEHQNRQTISI